MKNPMSKFRTVCEVLREINDLCQKDSKQDKVIRKKLAEAEKMAKSMALKLEWYNKNFIQEEFEFISRVKPDKFTASFLYKGKS